MSEDIFEDLFGKKPKEGYEFTHSEVKLLDSDRFKGFLISWGAKGVGFGELFYGWGVDADLKKYNQYGFHSDTENMNAEFVGALLDEVGPQMINLIMGTRR